MFPVSTLRRIGLLCLSVCIIFGSGLPVRAQQFPGTPAGDNTVPYQAMRQQLAQSAISDGFTALEGAVDPERYIVGPGDRFLISIGGAFPMDEQVMVSADGSMTLPDVGAIDAAGRTLEVVEATALRRLNEQFTNVPVSVSLVGLRHFYVHIAGAVPQAGRYPMLPIARLDDAIQHAFAARANAQPNALRNDLWFLPGSATSQMPGLDQSYQPALRKIKLIRREGEAPVTFDLLRYYVTGEAAFNPYLLDGDRIRVPAYHTVRGAVIVTGDLPYAGRFAYRDGDRARDALLLAAGPEILQTLDRVRLVRRGGEDPVTRTFSIADVLAGRSEPVYLQPGDLLDVLHTERATATIYGLVHYPGSYPVVPGTTTLQELVEMAGGLKPGADIGTAQVTRTSPSQEGDYARVFSEARLNGDLEAPHTVIDLESLAQRGSPVYLQDQDVVTFPRDTEMVFVSGNVPEPGYFPYVPGQSARYYIIQAGGRQPLVTAAYVIDAIDGEVLRGADAAVAPGVTVFVNQRALGEMPQISELAFERNRAIRQANLQRTTLIITGVTAAIGIIATLDRFGLFGEN